MLKAVIIPVLFMVLGVFFLLGSIGEKDYRNKRLYAIVAGALFVLLLISTRI